MNSLPKVNLGSYAIVIRHPNYVDRKGRVHNDSFQEGRLEIVAVKADGENDGNYLGQRVKPGVIYFQVQKPPKPNPQYTTFGVNPRTGYREWRVNHDQLKNLPGLNYLARAETSANVLNIELSEEAACDQNKHLREVVVKSLGQLAATLSVAAGRLSFLCDQDSYEFTRMIRAAGDEKEKAEISYRMFLGMLRSSKSGFLVLDESLNNSQPLNGHCNIDEQKHDKEEARRIPGKYVRYKKDPFVVADAVSGNGDMHNDFSNGYVRRVIDDKKPKSKTERNRWRKHFGNIERKAESKRLIQEGIQDYYDVDDVKFVFAGANI